MEKVSLELTKQEAQALLSLIDAAVKSLGMNGAEAGVVLYKKVQGAINTPPVSANKEAGKAVEEPKKK